MTSAVLRVEQAQVLEQDVDRHHHGDRRQDALGHHPEGDVVVAERALEAAAERRQQQQEQGGGSGDRHLPGRPEGYHGADGEQHAQHEEEDRPEPRAVGDPHQRVGRHAADRERDHRARGGGDHGVGVGADRVGQHVAEEVAPSVQRGLEVDPGEVERPAVDVDRQLHRGDGEPVEREQDDEGPQAEEDVGDDAADRARLVERAEPGRLPAEGGRRHQALPPGRRARLAKATQKKVTTNSSM